MTEQNWATTEAYNWLANDNSEMHNEIMDTDQSKRKALIEAILTYWIETGGMGNFTKSDLADVDMDSLAADFADPVDESRYGQDCNGCTFLGRSGAYDVYYHEDALEKFMFFQRPEPKDSMYLTADEASAVSHALDMVTEHIKEIGNDQQDT